MASPQGSLTIRPAERADLVPWATMRMQLWPEGDREAQLAELTDLLRDARFRGVAGLWDATPVGFAEAFIRPFANGCDSRPVAFLEGIWVGPEHRRRHVGARLLSAVEQWAGELGMDELGSDADIANALSLLCHDRWGFAEMERVVCFRKRLGPAG